MNILKKSVVVTIAMTAVFGSVVSAQAREPHYFSNVAVRNTTKQTIQLQWGWHQKHWGKNVYLKPGTTRIFRWKYSYPNQFKAPWFLLGVYNKVDGRKYNYHIRTTSSPTFAKKDSRYTTVILKSNSNGYVYAQTNNKVLKGHWKKVGAFGTWSRYVD